MAGMKPADSIFEFLTAKNPKITQLPTKSKSQTKSKKWHKPEELKLWEEFSFDTLEAIFDKTLIEEATHKCRSPSLPPYPDFLEEFDGIDMNEKTTAEILTKWNKAIVNRASLEVARSFQPCMWVSWDRDSGKAGQAPSLSDNSTNKNKKRGGGGCRLYPDSGAVSLCQSSQDLSTAGERVVKDYKVALKWNSSVISNGSLIDKTGRWRPGKAKKDQAMPIRQIYSYCVEYLCRYGIILTTSEAVIFRIKPRGEAPCSSQESTDASLLRRRLISDGLMEYVSVPWDNDNGGDPDNYKELTVNLAVWFVHVLAGNGHQVDWDYPLLQSSTLNPETGRDVDDAVDGAATVQETIVVSQEHISQDTVSASQKRRRNENDDGDDSIFHSFSESQPFATQSSSFMQSSTQGEEGNASERDVELDGESQGSENRSIERRRSLRRAAKRQRN
ncbi:hypothetical protein QBC46DRAFT_418644 [Diplogelasinospora grovesii]|uniref:Uncharacterized protein n=1 Tax=Diplogelasinospora grovesii TaxID=303347 RepID=A0AAN6N0L6_9PEZI|nr:hypothetical protein QBC46DRAFT_418644 [Diplogelasinospora grovesii]